MRAAKFALLTLSAVLAAPASAAAFGPATLSADSTYAGYGTGALADGRWLTSAEDAALAAQGISPADARRAGNTGHAWVSHEAAQDHWVVLEWASAQRIDGLELAWGTAGHRPAQYRVEQWNGSAWQTIVTRGTPAGQVESVDFATVTTTKLRVIQPNGQGGPSRPNLMMLQEARARFAPEADSSFSGYGTAPLAEGDWVTEGEDAAMDSDGVGANAAQRLGNAGTTWVSAETTGAHWVELAWSTPRTVSAFTVAWAVPQWRPREFRVEAWVSGAWQSVWSVASTPSQVAQRVRLSEAVTTTRLRLVQPDGKGNAGRPNLMAVQELQVHGEKTPDTDYSALIDTALGSAVDVLGEAAIATPSGPAWSNVADHLLPLGDVGPLTRTSMHYIPIGRSDTTSGDGGRRGLHVADGSQVIVDAAAGARVTTVSVGAGSLSGWARPGGKELYGSERDRLASSVLDGGLPVLQTAYVDRAGIGYRQESFTTRLPGVTPLVSFVKLTANRNGADASVAKVRFGVTGDGPLTRSGQQLLAGGDQVSAFSATPRLLGQDLVYTLDLSDGNDHTVYFARPHTPVPSGSVAAGSADYATARAAHVAYWEGKLAAGAGVSVPEPRVMDALRASLVQNLQMGTRYSVGNAYETTFPPESAHNAATLGEYGYEDYAHAGFRELLTNALHPTVPAWDRGMRLAGGAEYWYLTRDDSLLTLTRPATSTTYYEELAAALKQQVDTPKVKCNGLPDAENTDGDNPTAGCSAHGSAEAWRGMRDIAAIWGLTGNAGLHSTYTAAAGTLKTNLLAAVNSSSTTLVDGSVFTPERLLEPISPYNPITGTRLGSYWNLVYPYFSASELIDPASVAGRARIDYGLKHGAYFLGTQRFNYLGVAIGSCVGGGLSGYRTSGMDHVYGFSTARTLAAADKADRLALMLYGTLAHALTRGTYVGGEGAAIGVCPGESTRGFYLPPNSTQSATFLKVLRLLLVQEEADADGVPDTLHLGFATPRGWLENGKSFGVTAMPTSFGELTYEVRSNLAAGTVTATIEVPQRNAIGTLALRLRLPAGWSVQSATANGTSASVSGETIDLSGRTGTVQVKATVTT